MNFWWVDAQGAGGAATRLFGDIDRVFALDGEVVASDSLSRVLRVVAEGKRYYVKRYSGTGKNLQRRWFGLRRWLGPPRVRAEWRNLLAFREWGIPTATLVAYGLERRCGGFVRGALVTEEIPGATDLAQLSRSGDPRLRDRQWMAEVATQTARITRALHDAGFAHNDLKWRNLLVSGGCTPTVYLIDCPSGGFFHGPVLAYRMVKDLACLDKLAKRLLSRSQRLRFYLDYVGRERLCAEDRRRIRKIVTFFDGRD